MSWASSEALRSDALGSEVLGSQVLSSDALSSEVLRNDTSPQLSPLGIRHWALGASTLSSLVSYVQMRDEKARAGQGRQGIRGSMLGSDEKR